MHLLLLLHVFLISQIISILSFHIFIDNFVLFTVEVKFFDWPNLFIKSFNFKSVSINLWLVIFQFFYHFTKLVGSLLQILLINLQLFSNFWSTLFRQNIFKFDIKFFFFLDKDVFLRNLFRFSNQSLLKTLDLLDHFISFWVSAFEFSPSVDVEWFIKFVGEVFAFLLLF